MSDPEGPLRSRYGLQPRLAKRRRRRATQASARRAPKSAGDWIPGIGYYILDAPRRDDPRPVDPADATGWLARPAPAAPPERSGAGGSIRAVRFDPSARCMRMSLRTKVVATVGPATATPEMIFALARAGVDVFRLNLAHGTPESHGQVIRWVREAGEGSWTSRSRSRRPGRPEVHRPPPSPSSRRRIGVVLAPRTTRRQRLPTTFDALARDVSPATASSSTTGSSAASRTSRRLAFTAASSGAASSRSEGDELPGSGQLPALTEKDLHDLEFALKPR